MRAPAVPAPDERCARVQRQRLVGGRYESVRCEARGSEPVEILGSLYWCCPACVVVVRRGEASVDGRAGYRGAWAPR